MNGASLQIDDEEHEVANEPSDREHLHAEEVGRGDPAAMSPQERAPRERLAAAGSRLDTVFPQDALDRGAPNIEAEVAQRPAQARVAPRWALARHLQQLLRHVGRCRRSPRRAARLRAVVLRRDQPAVPTQDRLRRCERRELGERSPAQHLSLLRQKLALRVCEAQAPRAEASAEHLVLGLQICDGQLLPLTDPTGDQKDEELERGGELRRSHGRARYSPIGPAPGGPASANAPNLTRPSFGTGRDQQVRDLGAMLHEQRGAHALIGSSPPMRALRGLVSRAASSRATVLVTGETGTGKECVARALHAESPRRAGPFVAVNCSAMPGQLVESLLFGHERGAFTGAEHRRIGAFEQASGGTLLLDEIGDMAPDLQAKLLRVLEDHAVQRVGSGRPVAIDVRVVAATNADLQRRIEDGRFRADLYFRLNVVSLRLPPLSERREDIPELLAHFLGRTDRKIRLTEDGVDWLTRRAWPGNVREIRNAVERLATLVEGEVATRAAIEELLTVVGEPDRARRQMRAAEELLSVLLDEGDSKLQQIERIVLRQAVKRADGNKSQAARDLNIPRSSLERKLGRLGRSSAADDDDSPGSDESSQGHAPNHGSPFTSMD